jgi:hypothetical protein
LRIERELGSPLPSRGEGRVRGERSDGPGRYRTGWWQYKDALATPDSLIESLA